MLHGFEGLTKLSRLLDDTFPDGPPYVSLEADDRYALRNHRYVLRFSDELLATSNRTAADVAQVLVTMGYADDLRVHRCLEVQSDLTWVPRPTEA